MSAERQTSATADVAPDIIYELTSSDTSPSGLLGAIDKLKKQRRRVIATTLGILAFGGAAQARSDIAPTTAIPSVPMNLIQTGNGKVAPAKWTGVLEDAAKQPAEYAAMNMMGLVNELLPSVNGQQPENVYVKESIWAAPGQAAPDPTDFANLEYSIRAAQTYGYHVCLAVWPYTWGQRKKDEHWAPPTRPGRVRAYTTLLATVDGELAKDFGGEDPVSCWFIGNEPNNSTFWWPQFDYLGQDTAAADYENLLAHSYDTLKKISPNYIVIGGELSSHGNDDPSTKNSSISPGQFILDMGRAYHKSGRTEPIMNVFGFHPYGVNSSESPGTPHPNSTTIGVADYPTLVADLGKAFDGTAQAGSKLPVLYSEYGVESQIPPGQSQHYQHTEPARSGAVPEAIQAKYYNLYMDMAACQRNVIGAFIFHSMDERNKKGWQSGPFYYGNGEPKSSEPAISLAMTGLNTGGIPCS